MSVYIYPCHGCPIKHANDGQCSLHRDFRERVSGLGLRRAEFYCPHLREEVRVGRRITIKHVVDGGFIERVLPATIVHADQKKHLFRCVVDRGGVRGALQMDADDDLDLSDEQGRFRHVRCPRAIQSFLNEPDWEVCELGNVITPDGHCDFHPDRRNDDFPCLCAEARRLAEEAEADGGAA